MTEPSAEPVSRAVAAVEAPGLAHRVVRHGPVGSLAEAATARGVEPADVVKTLVVRRGDGDYLFVLVPGDRTIAWPKLRAALGVQRRSMPDAEAAKAATIAIHADVAIDALAAMVTDVTDPEKEPV